MLRTDASTAAQPIQTEKWLFRHLCLAFVPFTIFHRQTLAKENRNSATTQLKKVHWYAMSDTSHTPNVIYIQHSEPRHIRELQNLIMGARLYFHVLVSDRGLLEQNAGINQTKRGQLNTHQMQRANKSNYFISWLQSSPAVLCGFPQTRKRVSVTTLWKWDKNAKQGADNSQTPGQMLMMGTPIKQTTQVTCDAPLADSTRETLPDSWTGGKVKFWWRTSTEISGFSINYISTDRCGFPKRSDRMVLEPAI